MRGLCSTCYQRGCRDETLPPRIRLTAHELLAKSREGRSDDECWPWAGNISTSKGYGRVRVDGVLTEAHLWVWREKVGPVPEGHELDHLCHTWDETCFAGKLCLHRPCVNYVRHLEPVTTFMNWQRGRSISRLHGWDVAREHRWPVH